MLRHALFAVLCLASVTTVQAAATPECKPIVDADKARAAATSWHDKKTMQGTSMEMIRLDNDIYANMGGTGWKKMPPGMVNTVTNAAKNAEKFNVSECTKVGEESVGGVATTVYTFKTAIPGQPPFAGKVWIGNKDGLPYRESGEKFDGLTVYTGVTAPATK